MEFPWDDEGLNKVPEPIHDIAKLLDSFNQMHRALKDNFTKEQLQRIFREFLSDLENSLVPKLITYKKYDPVSGPRIKSQLELLLKGLKELFIKTDQALGDFEVKIKELIYSKCRFN